MAGVKGRSGGARPGAGRKSTKTVEYQATRRALMERMVTGKRWRAIVEAAITQAEKGDAVARAWLAAYIVGSPAAELVVKGDEDNPVRLKSYITVTPDDWPDP